MEVTIFSNAKNTLKKIIREATTDPNYADKLRTATATCTDAIYGSLNEFFTLSPEQLAELDLTDAETTMWNVVLRTRTPTIANVVTLAELEYIAAEDIDVDAAALSAAAARQTGGKASPSPKRRKPRPKAKRRKTRRKSKSSRK